MRWFDGTVVSSHEGVVKPEPEIFSRLLARFELHPERTLMIDDSSRNLETADWRPVEIFGSDVGAAIADLKARDDDGTILVHGGPNFAKAMTRLGLVDEYQLTWVPVAIGTGHSPFADLGEHLKLDLVRERRFASGAHGQVLVPKA